MTQTSFLPKLALPPPGESDEFYTPRRYFDPWNAEFRFTLDPCATPESAKCERFFHAGQDGLAQSWAGERVFMNPPYSNIAPWAFKAMTEALADGAELVVGLLPAWTDRAWWHDCIVPGLGNGVELRWIRGRIRFGFPGNPEGKGHHGGGTFPSVLVIWRRP